MLLINNNFVSIAMDKLHLATLNMLRLGCVVPATHVLGETLFGIEAKLYLIPGLHYSTKKKQE